MTATPSAPPATAAVITDAGVLPVTRPFLPPFEDYVELLRGIWERRHLTNAGPLVRELEARLAEYLGARHVFFVSNGTIAIQLAIKALELTGDVVTTPFSYVATTSSLAWEGCRPVFADIEPDTLTLDPRRVAEAVTPATTGILATHVYGNACDVRGLAEVARRHGLKVVYDAAHAFGARFEGRSLCAYGDIATLSFHATKLFHTVEGGAVVTDDDELAHRIGYLRNFGHNGQEEFFGVGVNGKNSEVHAAMGLAVWPYVPEILQARAAVTARYDALLERTGAPVQRLALRAGLEFNHAYYPVLFETEAALFAARERLHGGAVIPRRYFYPSLDTLPYVGESVMPIARDVSRRVLCLPLSADMVPSDADRVVGLLLEPA